MKFLRSALLLGVFSFVIAAADVALVEEIVAKINGDIITRTELDRSRKQLEAAARQSGLRGEALDKAVKDREGDILRDRIDQLLLVQKGKELNISVDTELSKYLADIRLKQRMADEDKFQDWVRDQTGMPFEDFKSETRNAMLTQRVIGQEVGSKISVTRAEMQKFYEENKAKFVREDQVYLSEILISTEGKEPAEVAAAEKKAKDLVARARKGEKFSELARDNSDAVTASQMGELGWSKKGHLSKSLEDLVFAKDKGFVSDPIKLPNGFLILRVDEKQKAGQADFEEVESEVRDVLARPRMEKSVREYLTKLRAEAFLEIKEGYVDSAPAPGKETKWSDPAQLRPETVTKEEVIAQPRKKRLLWMVPIPGTNPKPPQPGVAAPSSTTTKVQ
jgi:parvulin-like peptidyl-prolyl isomerase